MLLKRSHFCVFANIFHLLLGAININSPLNLPLTHESLLNSRRSLVHAQDCRNDEKICGESSSWLSRNCIWSWNNRKKLRFFSFIPERSCGCFFEKFDQRPKNDQNQTIISHLLTLCVCVIFGDVKEEIRK